MNDHPLPTPEPAATDGDGDADVELTPEQAAAVDAVAALANEPAVRPDEAARMDAAVMAMAAGQAVYREALAMSSGAASIGKRRSPRSRGKRPAPYFAVAAAIAIVLSIAIGLLASGGLTGGDPQDAPRGLAGERSVSGDSAGASVGASVDGMEKGVPSDNSAGDGAQRSPAAPEATARASRPPVARPELFLKAMPAGMAPAQAAEAALRDAAPVLMERDAAIASLVESGRAVGVGDDLARCLAIVPNASVPVRVTATQVAGSDVFVVVTAPGRGQAPASAVVLGRPGCSVVATVP